MPQLNHTLYYSTILWSFFFVFGFLYFCVFFILFPLVRTYKLVKLYQFFSSCVRNIYLLSFFFYSFFYLKNLYFFQFLCNNFRLFFFNIYFLFKDKYYICESFFTKVFYHSTFLMKRSLLFSTRSFFLFFFLDVPSSDQYFFQDPATPVMEGIINFHHDLLAIQIFIAIFVLWMLVRILVRFRHKVHPDSQDFVNKRETEYLTYINESAKLKSFEGLLVECSRLFSTPKGPLSWKDYLGFNALRDRRLFMGIICHLTEEDFKKSTLIVKKGEFSDLAVAVGRCFLIKSLYFNYLLIRISCFYYERGFITLEYRRAYRHNLREFYKVANKVYVEFLGPALGRSMKKYAQGSYVFADKGTIKKYDLGLHTRSHDHVHHHTLLEVVWTVIPTFILVYIAIPSFALLYAMDEIVAPVITVKVIGNQWYWRYELAVMKDIHYNFSDYRTFYKFNTFSKGFQRPLLNFLPIQSLFLDRFSTLFRYFIDMFVVNKNDIQGYFFKEHFLNYKDFSNSLFKNFNYSLVDGEIIFDEGSPALKESFVPIFGQEARYKYTFAGIETGLQKALELIKRSGHSINESGGQPVSSYLSSHGMVGIYILRLADILLENSLKNSNFLLTDYDFRLDKRGALDLLRYGIGMSWYKYIFSYRLFENYFNAFEGKFVGGVKNNLNSNMVLLLSLKKKKKFLLALIGKDSFYGRFKNDFSVFVGDVRDETRIYALKNYFLSTFFDLKSNSLKVGMARFATLFSLKSKLNMETFNDYKPLSNFILQTRLEQTLQRDFLMKIIKSNNKFSTFVNRAGKITYEARLVGKEDFNWFMIPNKVGLYRLLDTDNALLLPEKLSIRILVTATDVLHSWSVPSLGIKIDACPGRLNQVGLYLKRIGTFYGQCSEICGIHHAFMPIVVKSVHYSDYYNYKLTFLLKAFKRFLVWQA